MKEMKENQNEKMKARKRKDTIKEKTECEKSNLKAQGFRTFEKLLI